MCVYTYMYGLESSTVKYNRHIVNATAFTQGMYCFINKSGNHGCLTLLELSTKYNTTLESLFNKLYKFSVLICITWYRICCRFQWLITSCIKGLHSVEVVITVDKKLHTCWVEPLWLHFMQITRCIIANEVFVLRTPEEFVVLGKCFILLFNTCCI